MTTGISSIIPATRGIALKVALGGLAVTTLLVVILMSYAGLRMAEKHAPLVGASVELKYRLSLFHLWFEELVGGDPSLSETDVWVHLDRAEWFALAMFEGGRGEHGDYLPVDDPLLEQMIVQALTVIERLRQVGRKRLAGGRQHALGSDLDQEFDAVFIEVLAHTDRLEKEIKAAIAQEVATYRRLSVLLGVLVLVMTGITVWAGYRYESEIMRHVHALSELRQDLERSNADLQQFAYVASHDLREPLRTITSYLQLLERRHMESLSEDAREYMEFAISGSVRMNILILDLLEYSRLDTRCGDLLATDADAALVEARDNLSATFAESGATLQSMPLPSVMADRSQLVRLFQNLLENAVKYRSVDRPPVIRVEARPDAEMVRFHVADNGMGIDRRYFAKIFVIFQRLEARTKGEDGGTGLGLALCKKIVERHGGRIWVESKPGEGSTFIFTLPAGR